MPGGPHEPESSSAGRPDDVDTGDTNDADTNDTGGVNDMNEMNRLDGGDDGISGADDRIADPLLAGLMAELRNEVAQEVGGVDWDGLHASIVASAALPLARRRANRRSVAARVVRSFAPVAIAAGIAFALWMGPGIYEDVFLPAPTIDIAESTPVDEELFEDALRSDLTEEELLQLVNGSPEMMLAVAIRSR
jgi:hypothetical protein